MIGRSRLSSTLAAEPCPSTRMVSLQLRLQLWPRPLASARLLDMVVAAAAQERGAGGDEASDDREAEGGIEPVAEGARDQVREEGVAFEDRAGVRSHRFQRPAADQVRDRVCAEEGGE